MSAEPGKPTIAYLGEGSTVYPTVRGTPSAKVNIGKNCVIYDGVFVGADVDMDDDGSIHGGTWIIGGGHLAMKRGASLGYLCAVITATQTPAGRMSSRAPRETWELARGSVVLEAESFVGAHCTLMPGACVGEGAVVGAGAYVDGAIPAWTVVRPKQELVSKPRRRPKVV